MTSKLTINLVVGILGLIAVVLIAGAFILIIDSKSVPETVWTLIGTTVGALASLLVSTRAGDVPSPSILSPSVFTPIAQSQASTSAPDPHGPVA